MTRNTEDLAAVIMLVLILLIPFGLIILAFPAEPYAPVSGEPIRAAAAAAGISVVNARPVTWPLPGATGGTNYVLADQEGTTVHIQTQSFDSSASRDAAVRIFAAQSAGKGTPVRNLVVVGNQLVAVGPDPGGILTRIRPGLMTQEGV